MSHCCPPPPSLGLWTSVTLLKWEPPHLQLQWYLATNPFILSQQDSGKCTGTQRCYRHSSLFCLQELHPWRNSFKGPKHICKENRIRSSTLTSSSQFDFKETVQISRGAFYTSSCQDHLTLWIMEGLGGYFYVDKCKFGFTRLVMHCGVLL